MKLVMAVVQDRDTSELLKALIEAGYRATKLASSGGFLRSGNTTLMTGVPEEKVEDVIGIIKRACKSRTELMTASTPAAATGDPYIPFATEVQVGGAIVFVLPVERFDKC